MSRAPRSYETNDHAHSMKTSTRLRKPMSKSKCRSSQASHAGAPESLIFPRSATAAERPIVASEPLSL